MNNLLWFINLFKTILVSKLKLYINCIILYMQQLPYIIYINMIIINSVMNDNQKIKKLAIII